MTCNSNCSVILSIPLNSSIFNKNNSVSEILINGVNQPVPVGTFNTAQELADLLSQWTYNLVFNHVYILETVISNFMEGNVDRITFSDLTSFDLEVECCKNGEGGEEGGSGGDGEMNGGSGGGSGGGDTEEDLLAIETSLTDCIYTGVFDSESSVFDFLDNINAMYYILSAKDSPSNVVQGPFGFSNNTEFQSALGQMGATLIGNLMTIRADTETEINQVYFLNSGMNVIASIPMVKERCCPSGFGRENEVLVKLGGNGGGDGEMLGWVPISCLPEAQRDLAQEVCQLPLCQKYKCVLTWDLSLLFLGQEGGEGAAPWSISQIRLLGVDMTALYSGKEFATVGQLAAILEELGWVSNGTGSDGSSVYQFCVFRDSLPSDNVSDYHVVNNMNSVIFSGDIAVECMTLDDSDIMLMMKVGNKGVFLGGPTKIFDSVETCSGLTFTCSTVVVPADVFSDLTEGGEDGPWYFSEIKVAGVPQVVLTTQFTSLSQMIAVLENMGWKHVGAGVYTLDLTVGTPSTQSYLKIRVVGGGGGGSGGEGESVFVLNTSCIADCVPENENRLILTRDEDGKYCWQSPSCFKGGDMNIMLDNGLDQIQDCNINPQFTIEILLKDSLIGLIHDHFSSNGPFWINYYKLEAGFGGGVSGKEEIFKVINGGEGGSGTGVLSLEALRDCLVELGWEVVEEEFGNGNLSQVRLSLVRAAPLVTAVCINRQGELGVGIPFDFVIPITTITNLICPGLSQESQVLIKGPTGYCFVDIECFMPIIPPPVDVDKALCDLPLCSGDNNGNGETGDGGFEFRNCVKLDDCDLTRIENAFGGVENVFIVGYRLIDNTMVDLPGVGESVGGGTFAEYVQAFVNLGWDINGDINNPPVEASKVNDLQIKYVVIDKLGNNPDFAPFPILLSASCSEVVDCPSLDPENLTLIKKPDGDVCWTRICPVSGPQGPAGEMGVVGPTGTMGATGPSVVLQLGVTGLNIVVCEELCGTGTVHYGIQPAGGESGVSDVSISLEPRGDGFLSAQKPTPGETGGGDCRGDRAVDWQMFRNYSYRTAGGDFSVIGGGADNAIYSFYSLNPEAVDDCVVNGGRGNRIFAAPISPTGATGISLRGSAILSGSCNLMSCGGQNDSVVNSVVVGGFRNGVIMFSYSANNSVNHTVIGGGSSNTIRFFYNSGNHNVDGAVIAGGIKNNIQFASPGSGYDNGSGVVIGGGQSNSIAFNGMNQSALNLVLAGGGANSMVFNGDGMTGDACVIGGGQGNVINVEGDARGCIIGGGVSNMITAAAGAVSVQGATISGGVRNGIGPTGTSVNSPFCTVGGGLGNRIDGSSNAYGGIIAGGVCNLIRSTAGPTGSVVRNTIGGGYRNIIGVDGEANATTNSVIAGGYNNQIFITAGISNSANVSTISGGAQQRIGVISGDRNSVNFSSVRGGLANQIVCGGTGINMSNSHIGGLNNSIKSYGQNIFSSGNVIGGGIFNNIRHEGGNTGIVQYSRYNSIASGIQNNILVNGVTGSLNYSTIEGGRNNTIRVGTSATPIGGGQLNSSHIGGGRDNLLAVYGVEGTNNYSVVGGGRGNEIRVNGDQGDTNFSIIAGGVNNSIVANSTASHAVIGGGLANKIGVGTIMVSVNPTVSRYNTIAGGRANSIYSEGSGNTFNDNSILGGNNNDIETSGGVTTNTVSENVIGGGSVNKIQANYDYSILRGCGVLSGRNNRVFTAATSGVFEQSVIVGGNNNEIRNDTSGNLSFSVIGGGGNNEIYVEVVDASSANSVIAGGFSNRIVQSSHSTISGGINNKIDGGTSVNFSSRYNTICGGRSNVIYSNSTTTVTYNTIGGGFKNKIEESKFSIVAGGQTNKIEKRAGLSSDNNGIFGGENNFISSGDNNVIIGGSNNRIDSALDLKNCAIIGGYGLRITAGGVSAALPQVVIGRYNSLAAVSGGTITRLFSIGDGTSDGARLNSFSVDHLGNVRAGGAFIPGVAADFAEYFESFDGQTIPIGTSVIIDPDTGKIRAAEDKPDIAPIGVISGNPGVLGNSADIEWQGRFLRDDFGRFIYEKVNGRKERKLNPNYDPKKPYTPRKYRPEWNIVGLLGQIHILKGQPVAPGWIKIKNMPDKPCDVWLVK